MSAVLHDDTPRHVLSLWKGYVPARPIGFQSHRQIMAIIAEKYGVSMEDICRPFGPRNVAKARHHAMWALRQERHPRRSQEPRWSYPRIAEMFWPTMDHTSVCHGVKAHAARVSV